MNRMVTGALVAILLTTTALAQTSTSPPTEQTPPPPAATTNPPPATAQQKLTEGQIAQLVAPIALYPDALLSQVLMASTYPLEVVEAARWSHDNPNVKDQALQGAMQKQPWDPSVKALTAVPQTLQMMSDKLAWTQQLGDAFLAQQQDVMDEVQRLRARAEAAGELKSTPQQRVTRVPPPAGVAPLPGVPQAIVIEPVNPGFYYVPIYDPAVVYGAWAYPAYPPFYWSPPGFVAGGVLGFTAGVAAGAALWGNFDWWHRNVNIDVNRFNTFNRTNLNIANNTWAHNPAHRGNVPYRDAGVAQRFNNAGRNAIRPNNVVRPNLPNAGSRAGNSAARNAAAGRRPANTARNGKRISGATKRPAVQRLNVNRPHVNRSNINRPNVNRARPGGARGFQAARPGRAGFQGRRGGVRRR